MNTSLIIQWYVVLKDATDFERAVYAVVAMIPPGETRSYRWVAHAVGNPQAVRAVGRALKKNPLLLTIPCHRVIASDGSLGGFALGRDMKQQLLAVEQKLTQAY